MNRNIFFGTVIFLLLGTLGIFYYSVGVAGKEISELQVELDDINERFNELSMVSETYEEFKVRFSEKVTDFYLTKFVTILVN